MKIAFIIQARVTSSRLKGKILENIGNKKVIDWVIEAIKRRFDLENIILAIPENKENDIIARLYGDKLKIIRGSEIDVAKRFIKGIDYFDLDYVIRICSDNPFIQTKFIEEIYDIALSLNPDYISYYCGEINCIKKPLGFFAEGFSTDKFKKAYYRMDKYDKEHVTPIFYEKGINFNIIRLKVPRIINETEFIRFTLDNKSDLLLYKEICKKYPKDYYTYLDLIEIIKSDNIIFEKMKSNYLFGGKM